ncbi:MAG TPA: aromatic ring-hydroxylating dioxygenase subunit alpha [Actinomycetota bacterium]|nr:aromatic ring-hydroxylating dioxygenase subunit alpha [Actinomycetota bacterium]
MTSGQRTPSSGSPASPAGGLERTLPREAYLSPRAFELEVERIFRREWFCVGREDVLARPGDFLHVEVVGEAVLVVRDREGGLRAFHDVCRHRGSRLVLDEPGPAAGEKAPGPSGRFRGSIVCPYHAWTYGLDGRLRNAPFLDERHGLRRDDLPLHPVAVAAWGGFAFVRLDDAAGGPSLAEQLGPVPDRLRRYPLGELRAARRITYDVGANWKVIAENYNECYHCGPVHPELCELVPAFKREGGAGLDWDRGVPHREGAWTFTFSGTTDRRPFPGLTPEERERHKGELVYPNLMLSLSADHVAAFTLWPVGPERTLVACDFLFHRDEIGRAGFDPSDAVGFWDLVNRQDWRICRAVQRGMHARPFRSGFYAPMEDLSLDIRRYVLDRIPELGLPQAEGARP